MDIEILRKRNLYSIFINTENTGSWINSVLAGRWVLTFDWVPMPVIYFLRPCIL